MEKRILLLPRMSDYPEARERAKARGLRLTSNVLHDEYLLRDDGWKQMARMEIAWARELLVYPAIGGEFRKGNDVVDSETGWVFPASYVPDEALRRKGAGLFVDPDCITKEGGKTIVHSAGTDIVLFPFIQKSEGVGRADEATRVPLALASESGQNERWLFRSTGIGVRPLSRDYSRHDSRLDVDAGCRPDMAFCVTVELPSAGARKPEMIPEPISAELLAALSPSQRDGFLVLMRQRGEAIRLRNPGMGVGRIAEEIMRRSSFEDIRSALESLVKKNQG